ncbi:unnamed protein product [Lactuca saligna]|uniref:Uncharacterized protein n=1 Tax=Lactuca saligna TaxID=75948 RepID=A0AA36E9C4_LACSI|nr:unnamed protein product [Lactuca saligna]
MGNPLPTRNSPIKSSFEEIGNYVGSVKESNLDTMTNQGDSVKVSNLKQTTIIPSEVSHTESFHKEVQTSDISVNISHMDTNLNMGKGVLNNEALLNQDQVKALKDVSKERHVLLIQDVKKVRKDVNLKIQELREDMGKEVATLNHNYSSLHQKVDIIVGVVTNFVTLYQDLVPKFDKMDDVDITPELLSKKFTLLESTTQKELAPLVKSLNMMPTDTPPISTGVVTRVLSIQIPTSLPKVPTVLSSTTTTSKPILKWVVIGMDEGELSKEEKKAAMEREIEMQRQIQSILRQRANDLPGLKKKEILPNIILTSISKPQLLQGR